MDFKKQIEYYKSRYGGRTQTRDGDISEGDYLKTCKKEYDKYFEEGFCCGLNREALYDYQIVAIIEHIRLERVKKVTFRKRVKRVITLI